MNTNKKIYKALADGCCDALRVLLSDNSPFPKFRDEWLEGGKPIAAKYLAGVITKRQMIAEYKERNANLIKTLFVMFTQQDNEAAEMVRRDIYQNLRAA